MVAGMRAQEVWFKFANEIQMTHRKKVNISIISERSLHIIEGCGAKASASVCKFFDTTNTKPMGMATDRKKAIYQTLSEVICYSRLCPTRVHLIQSIDRMVNTIEVAVFTIVNTWILGTITGKLITLLIPHLSTVPGSAN